MGWEEVLKFSLAVFASAVSISGAVAWLSKALFKFWFDKELDTHRARLNAEIETHKALLKKDADEYQRRISHELSRIEGERAVVFSRLHSDRADIIRQFYFSLCKLNSLFVKFVNVQIVESSDDTLAHRFDAFLSSYLDMCCFFRMNKIYFDNETCSVVDELIEGVQVVLETLHGGGEHLFVCDGESRVKSNYSESNLRKLSASFVVWKENISKIQGRLECKFRVLLGVQ